MYDQLIKFRAEHQPHTVAVTSIGRDVTYRQFDQDIDRVACGLAEADLSGSKLAFVSVRNLYSHWLILLALARLGVGSVTIIGQASPDAIRIMAPDVIIIESEKILQNVHNAKVVHASPEWIAHLLKREAKVFPQIRPDPNTVARITVTSGSTGRPKAVARTWRQAEDLVMQRTLINGAMLTGAEPERLLCFFGLDTIAFYLVLTTWARGGALVLATSNMFQVEDVYYRLAPSVLAATPVQLRGVLDRLPVGFSPNPKLSILTGGSHLPPTLRRALGLRLTPAIWNMYGSSEADVVAIAHVARLSDDLTAAGWLVAGAQVQIVDENDVVLPAGDSGLIRLLTRAVVSGYMGDEKETKEHFKDGWFYPGDVGSLSANGLLRIEGRSDEVMNFGGVKRLPGTIEDAALSCSGVEDAAAFSVIDDSGLATLWLAIVRGDGLDQAELNEALRPLSLRNVHIVWVQQIPRNARGKIERDRLRAAVPFEPERPRRHS